MADQLNAAAEVATPEQRAVLNDARNLSDQIRSHWSRHAHYDDVMLLVADLFEAHADTGIEMQTWPRALDVVMSHLAADPSGTFLLEVTGVTRWFTVAGIWSDGRAHAMIVVPGRRHLETAKRHDRRWRNR